MPSHYLSHCWLIVNWNLNNKIQWISCRNLNIFIRENAFENVCQSGGHLSRPQCVNSLRPSANLCISKLTSIASNNGLSPGQPQAIIWNNAGILLIGPLGTNFSEILIEIHTFSLKKIRLKMSYAKCRPFCLGLNVLTLHHAIWCCQPSHYQIKQWPISVMPYHITRALIQYKDVILPV